MFDFLKPKKFVGLSMSGGGVKGIIYLGVIKALIERGLEPKVFGGLSAGALIAGALGSGMSVDDVLRLTVSTNYLSLLDNNPLDGIELMDHHKVIRLLRETVGDICIEDCRPKVVIFATNVSTKQPEALTKGDLASAMAASCALPPLMSPIEREGMRLMEGGFTVRYGAKYLRKLGANYVIGSDVDGFSNTKLPGVAGDFYEAIACALNVIREYEQRYDPVDMEIANFTDTTGMFEFQKAGRDLVEIGYLTAEGIIKERKL